MSVCPETIIAILITNKMCAKYLIINNMPNIRNYSKFKQSQIAVVRQTNFRFKIR